MVNNRAISAEQSDRYRADGANQILLDQAADAKLFHEGVEIVTADLLDEGEMVRHDPARLARVVIACAANTRSRNFFPAEMLSAN